MPFLVETADADDDAVQHRAGLDARLYLRMVWTMMVFFGVIAGVAICVMLPLNLVTEKASWFPENSFLITTANGFAHVFVAKSMLSSSWRQLHLQAMRSN